MKEIFQSVISRGGYDLAGLLKNIDKYHIEGKLTDEEREELYTLARGQATPENSADLFAKVQELEARIAALESGGGSTEETPDEYTAGKWYYTGDKCLFNSKTYVCIAPKGTVCVWSPAEYPAYWEVSA